MKIEKLGTEFEAPIGDVIDQIYGYKVYGSGDYRNVKDEKAIPFNGEMIRIITDLGESLWTPWHICKIRLNDGHDVLLYAKDVKKGMMLPNNYGIQSKITEVENVTYNGTVYGFEIDDQAERPSKVRIERLTYDDGSEEFVLGEPENVSNTEEIETRN
jgi:hypothetical protein